MLKRNVAILIASGLLSAQVNLAAADQGTIPVSADDQYWELLPVQSKYLEQRAASIQREAAARGSAFPTSGVTGAMSPVQRKYLEERATSIQKGGAATYSVSSAGTGDPS